MAKHWFKTRCLHILPIATKKVLLANFLARDLNADKIVLFCAPISLLAKVVDSRGFLSSSVKSSLWNLVVTMNQPLALGQHV